jgi:AraC-like DNA-binding protein
MSLSTPFRHALPVTESLFHEALYLTHAGWERIKPRETYPQNDVRLYTFEWRDGRVLPDFCLALNIAGSGELETRSHRGRVETGDVFLFRPGEWHRHRPSPEIGWTIMWIHFNGDEPQRWLHDEAFNLRDNIPIIENRPLFRAQFEHLIESVHRDPSRNSPSFSRQAIGLLSHFVIDASGGTVGRANQVQDELVNAAVEYIWNFSHGFLDIPAVARKVGLARRTLDRRFRAATGHSVLDEIQLCRVSRAANLLEATAISIKQIVFRAGFSSREQLRLSFKKIYGKSPQAYRKKARPEPDRFVPWSLKPRPSIET